MSFQNSKYYIFSLTLILVVSIPTYYGQGTIPPQTNGYWLVYNGDNKLNDNFGLHTEAQVRNLFISDGVGTKIARIGLHYYRKPHAMFTVGYAYIHNTPENDELNASQTGEHRAWQQAITRQIHRGLFMEHRYRLEQRFIYNYDNESSREEHRIRYRFQTIFPMYVVDPRLRHYFLTANNEVMINFSSNPANLFDRNRFYAGIGYQVSPKLNFQLGYLNQYAQAVGNPKGIADHVIQFVVAYNMDDLMQSIFKP